MTAQAVNGRLKHGVCIWSALPGSWEVAYPWVRKRWWDIALYRLWKSGNGEESYWRCYCCHIFFSFFKHWNTVSKLWWSLPVFHPFSSWMGNLLQTQGAAHTTVVWLCSRTRTVFSRCLQVTLCTPLNTEACKAVPEEKFPCQQTTGQSLGLRPWSCIQCKQIPMRFSESCSVILLHLS